MAVRDKVVTTLLKRGMILALICTVKGKLLLFLKSRGCDISTNTVKGKYIVSVLNQ